MDATPGSFAYRCLPLNIANAHGWELLTPCGFEACWDGGSAVDAVAIRLDADADPARAPVSLFGQGVLTFHIEGLFRTPPGWNLWVGGSPNRFKDAIAPLTGVVETDWAPFTFTMNWRFTRPAQWVRFEALEPVCFLFPVRRDGLERFRPRLAPLASDPELSEGFAAWSEARNAFQERMSRAPPQLAADAWQKHYYRGTDVAGRVTVADHKSKLRLHGFRAVSATAPSEQPSQSPPKEPDAARAKLRRREWLLEAIERQRSTSPKAAAIERCTGLSRNEFLERFYAPSRPVILAGEMTGWKARERWTPEYLAEHLESELRGDLECFTEILARQAVPADGILSLAQPGELAKLSCSPRNQLIAQVVGCLDFKLLPASEAGRVEPGDGNEPPDLFGPSANLRRFPGLEGARLYEVSLAAGEAIFLPLGWWRQTRAACFSATLTYTQFPWPNDVYAVHE